MIRRLPAVASVVVLSVLVLAGCAAPAETVSDAMPTPEVASPSAEPSPTASDTPDSPPPVEELVLRPDGIGDLVIGTAEGIGDGPADMVRLVDDYCANAWGDGVPAAGSSEADAWVPISDYRSEESDEIFVMGTYVADGVLMGVEVRWFGDVVTTEGIGIGSTRADVETAYPDAWVEAQSFESQVLVVRRGEHQLQIELLNPDVQVDPEMADLVAADSVINMRAVPADQEPRARWRTGDILSPCGSP